MPRARLTYCSNVHAAPDLPTHLDALHRHALPIAEQCRRAGAPFGLGLWWPMQLAHELAHDVDSTRTLLAFLDGHDLPIWTLNAFPFDGFHADVVKTAVYQPDWSREERLHYTRVCADVLGLLGDRDEVAISTLPLGWRAPAAPEPDLRLMARNLARCASAFAAVEKRTGVRCILALEPEPDCLLETARGAADFLERWLFEEGAWTTVPADVLRRHLGVCVDLCHLLVVGEDPVAAIADLRARGIAVPKVQVSSCLEVRSPEGLDRLLGFAEPRYLHQTVAERGPRALDLDAVAARRAEFAAGGRIRSHYHVPLYWDEPGPFGSTQQEVARVLRELARLPGPLPLFEVETYTWGVLGDLGGTEPLADRIAREIAWARSCLES